MVMSVIRDRTMTRCAQMRSAREAFRLTGFCMRDIRTATSATTAFIRMEYRMDHVYTFMNQVRYRTIVLWIPRRLRAKWLSCMKTAMLNKEATVSTDIY